MAFSREACTIILLNTDLPVSTSQVLELKEHAIITQPGFLKEKELLTWIGEWEQRKGQTYTYVCTREFYYLFFFKK